MGRSRWALEEDAAGLQSALALLNEAAGNHERGFPTRRIVLQAARHLTGQGEDEGLVWLANVGAECGLDVRLIRARLGDALESVRAGSSVVTCVRTEEGGTRWLVLSRRSVMGRYRVHAAGEEESGRWLSVGGLSRLLRRSGEELRTWAVVEIAAPLDAIVSQGVERTPLSRLRALLRTERADIWVIVIYAVAIGLLSLATPLAVQVLINTVAFTALLQPVIVLALLLIGCLGFAALLRGMQTFTVEILQRRIFVRVVMDLADRLPRTRIEAFDRQHGPGLLNRFFDVLTIQKAASGLLIDGLSAVLQALVGLLLLGLYHPVLLGFDLFLLLCMTVIIFGLGRGAEHSSIKESKMKYAIAGWLQEVARSITVFKSAGGAAHARAQVEALTHGYLNARAGHFKVYFRQIIGVLALQIVTSALLLGLGGWLVVERQLTLGQLVAAELIVTMVLAAFAKFGSKLDVFYDVLAAVDKLGQLVDLPLEPRQHTALPTRPETPAALSMRGVSYAYPDNARVVLSGLDLEVERGCRVAIIREAGAGSSTLADLLAGLRQPQSGVMLFDGISAPTLRRDLLRREAALVRGLEVIDGSVIDNILVGRDEISVERVFEVLDALELTDVIAQLEQGINTILSPGGSPLSRVHALLVGFARAIIASPRMLVVDGVLDELRGRGRERVQRLLFDERAPWSLIVISRDQSLISCCDAAYELADGQLRPFAQGGTP